MNTYIITDYGVEANAAKLQTNTMTDEEIKVKALGQAINIAKLLSGVKVDDVIEIATKCAKYIKG